MYKSQDCVIYLGKEYTVDKVLLWDCIEYCKLVGLNKWVEAINLKRAGEVYGDIKDRD